MSMNIETAKKGTKITVTAVTLQNGKDDQERENAKKYLQLKRKYTVKKKRAVKGVNRTEILLDEIPGEWFNSVFFEDVDKLN